MEALAELYFRSLPAPIALAFIIECAINRRPVVVALVVATIFSLVLIPFFDIGNGYDGPFDYIAVFLFNMLFGGLAALIGSGAARGLRLWIELRQEDQSTDN